MDGSIPEQILVERRVVHDFRSRCGADVLQALPPGDATLVETFEHLESQAPAEGICRHSKRGVLAFRINLQPQTGAGHWKLARVRNELYVLSQDARYKQTYRERVGGTRLVELKFQLSGEQNIVLNAAQPAQIARPSLYVWNNREGGDLVECAAAGAHHRTVSMAVEPQFLLDEVLTPTADLPGSLHDIVRGGWGPKPYLQFPLSAQMLDVANRLIDNAHTGALGLVYLEALAMELLCEAVACLGSNDAPGVPTCRSRDLRCVHSARSILMRQYAPPPTIRQLARTVGLNESSLKRYFKATFGETIFAYSLRCRMERARALLLEGLPISKVGEAVGYSHPTSFAAAFRRHFKTCPKHARQSGPPQFSPAAACPWFPEQTRSAPAQTRTPG